MLATIAPTPTTFGPRCSPQKPTLQRARSAFMFFAEEQRPTVQAANPAVHHSELGKLLGEKWLEMSAEDKQVLLWQCHAYSTTTRNHLPHSNSYSHFIRCMKHLPNKTKRDTSQDALLTKERKKRYQNTCNQCTKFYL